MFPPEKVLEADCILTIRNWVGQVNRKVKATIAYRDIKCTIILEPCQTIIPFVHVPGLDCKRDCLELIREIPGLSQPKMMAMFEARRIIWSSSTVAHVMAELVASGEVIGPKPGSKKGYRFPDQ